MNDFISAALPWVIIGISVAIFVVTFSHRNKRSCYVTEGIFLGLCGGATFGAAGAVSLSLGISLGLLVGAVVGACIEKK